MLSVLTIGGIKAKLMTWNSVSHFQFASKIGQYRANSCFVAELCVLPSSLASVYREKAWMKGANNNLSNSSFFTRGNATTSSGNSLSVISYK